MTLQEILEALREIIAEARDLEATELAVLAFNLGKAVAEVAALEERENDDLAFKEWQE